MRPSPAAGARGGSGASSAAAAAAALSARVDAEYERIGSKTNKGHMGEDEFGAFCEELVGDSVEDPALSGALFHFFGPERRPKATDLTKELWRIGCAKLKVSTVAELKSKLPSIRKDLATREDFFKNVYCLAYLMNCDPGAKTLSKSVSVSLARIFLSPSAGLCVRHPHAPLWIEFLERREGEKGTPFDTWTMVFSYFVKVAPDASNYEAISDAWPCQIDDFVAWVREGRGGAGGTGGGGAAGGAGGSVLR